jgi:hypothetical protein
VHCKYIQQDAEQFPDINKLCDVACCWIYEYIGILLGVRPILHISRVKVKKDVNHTVSLPIFTVCRVFLSSVTTSNTSSLFI